jgi:O-antigen ligase
MFVTRIINLTFEENYTAGRNYLWHVAMEMTGENPFFGVGLSGFEAAEITIKSEIMAYPHNIFLEVLCETGIIGFFLFLSAGIAGIYALRRDWRFINIVSLAALVLNLILAQSSGQIFDSRGLIIFLYLSLIPDRTKFYSAGRSREQKAVGRA